MNKGLSQANPPLEKVPGGGAGWGYLRLGLILALIFVLAWINQSLWSEPGVDGYSLGSPNGWRYLVPAVVALLGGLLANANYVTRLHHLSGLRAGLRYIWASATSLGLPRLHIQEGKPEIEVGGANLIQQAGGPGYLNVRPGTAVVMESLDEPTRVIGAGRHFVSRLERIREVISLADQQGQSEKFHCMSKDGLEVQVQRLQYRFRLLPGPTSSNGHRTALAPYPFAPAAARDLAYRRTVNAFGLVSWDFAVKIAVEGIITDYVNANWFDKVMAPLPGQSDPRDKMGTDMQTLKTRLAGFGTELLWTDIGNFVPASARVGDQRVETWGAKWDGAADVETAKADAQRMVAQELGRAEAQAELLNNLLGAVRQATQNQSGDVRQNIRTLIILRTAQLLETMVESNRSVAQHTPPIQPPSLTVSRMLIDD